MKMQDFTQGIPHVPPAHNPCATSACGSVSTSPCARVMHIYRQKFPAACFNLNGGRSPIFFS